MPTKTAPEPFCSLIHEWERALHAENKSRCTIECYTTVARLFHHWLARTDDPPSEPEGISTGHVRNWIAYRLDTTSPGNANNNYRALQRWFAFLLNEGEIDQDPMSRMSPPSIPEKMIPVIPEESIQAVLADCRGTDLLSRRDTALIRLFWDTGARLSEIANLKVDDVDLKTDVIRVTGKGGRERAIPFSPKTGQALSRYLRVRARQRHAQSPYLWLAEKSKGRLARGGIRFMLRRRGMKAGINEKIGRNLHAHLGRHFVSHHFQAEGGSEGDLMLLMGWVSPQMPKRYGKSAATERAHAAARKLRLGDRL